MHWDWLAASIVVLAFVYAFISFQPFSVEVCQIENKYTLHDWQVSIDNKTNEWTNERTEKTTHSFIYNMKNSFRAGAFTKKHVSNSFDTYECFQNMFQPRMQYVPTYDFKLKWILRFCMSWFWKKFHSVQKAMKCPYRTVSKFSVVRSNQWNVKLKTWSCLVIRFFVGTSLGNFTRK